MHHKYVEEDRRRSMRSMEVEQGTASTLRSPPLPDYCTYSSFSDMDSTCSFSSTTFTSSTSSSCCSARSSFSFTAPSSDLSSSGLLKPHPHRSSDPHWSAIRAAAALSPDASLHLHHLKLLRPLGSGNLARVFHCRILTDGGDLPSSSSSPDFALKVIDTDALTRSRNLEKLAHVSMEGDVLASLDHPFLPTLYARLDSPRHTCFLIDYCPGGDLHSLLRRQPGGRFPLQAAKFYAAEVLLALEYLHASGFVYRDLKPENILRRADGHLMLSDFDLCLKAEVTPAIHHVAVVKKNHRAKKKKDGLVCCFGGARGMGDDDRSAGESSLPETETVTEFVAEPRTASSKECVGTHEYLAPEVITRDGHGNGVDWWAFGVFIYEMLYGRTPFKGGTKESTLKNIRSRPLRFPASTTTTTNANANGGEDAAGMAAARDLVERLLVKDPRRRLGSARGAADIKRHPFFEGIRWPLIRNYPAPTVGGQRDGAARKRASLGKKVVVALSLLGLGDKKKTTTTITRKTTMAVTREC